MKTTANYILAICAALTASWSFAAEPVAPCGPVHVVEPSQLKGAIYLVSMNIFDQKSKSLKTTFEVVVDDDGSVLPVQSGNEISRANFEPVVVGTFASLQAVSKGDGKLLRVCARIASLADKSPAAQLMVNETKSMLEMPLVVGEESRATIGSDEMVVRVAGLLVERQAHDK